MRYLRWVLCILAALFSFVTGVVGFLYLVAAETSPGLILLLISVLLGAACFTARPPHRITDVSARG